MDNPLMGPDHLRTDVSVTIFLSDPEDYDGGELVMETTGGEAAYKLPAGSAVTYPTTMLHRVEPVTRGTREVAVTWAQSLVRRADHREILFDLERVARSIFERDGKTRGIRPRSTSRTANLRRMWVELVKGYAMTGRTLIAAIALVAVAVGPAARPGRRHHRLHVAACRADPGMGRRASPPRPGFRSPSARAPTS